MSKAITVLGAGSWGTALAIALARNGQQTRLWGHDPQHIKTLQDSGFNQTFLPDVALPKSITLYADIGEALTGCDDILIVVPSEFFRVTLQQALPYITPEVGVCWATKGIDHDSGHLLHDVVSELCGEQQRKAVLSGPSFAKEVAQGLPTAITLACSDKDYAKQLQQRFHAEHFRVYLSQDVIGVQLGGAVKNVLAIATGTSDGLGFGANARCALITRGLAEMIRLGTVLGGATETFMGLAGMGDLILTCTDDQSRNRRFGLALGKGKALDVAEREIGQVVEGVKNAAEVYRLAKQHQIEMPICEQVYQVVNGHITAAQAVKNLLAREAISEN